MNVYPIFELLQFMQGMLLTTVFHIGYLKSDWTHSEEPKLIAALTACCIILGVTLKYV